MARHVFRTRDYCIVAENAMEALSHLSLLVGVDEASETELEPVKDGELLVFHTEAGKETKTAPEWVKEQPRGLGLLPPHQAPGPVLEILLAQLWARIGKPEERIGRLEPARKVALQLLATGRTDDENMTAIEQVLFLPDRPVDGG